MLTCNSYISRIIISVMNVVCAMVMTFFSVRLFTFTLIVTVSFMSVMLVVVVIVVRHVSLVRRLRLFHASNGESCLFLNIRTTKARSKT